MNNITLEDEKEYIKVLLSIFDKDTMYHEQSKRLLVSHGYPSELYEYAISKGWFVECDRNPHRVFYCLKEGLASLL